MRLAWLNIGRPDRSLAPLEPASIRLLVAGAIGVLICMIWLTGMMGNSHRVTMLALSGVSLLGLGLVLELRRRYVAEETARQAKEEADKANRAKSAFLATMSHELRTPLNAIIGFADIMQSEVMGPVGNDKYRSYVSNIHESGTHLLALINDLLDLTKAEAGKLDLCEDVFDVEEVIRSIARIGSASIEEVGLTVTIHVPPGLPRLRADERKIRQVLFNLIGNAVKFTPAGGNIAITGRCDPQGGIEIAVADTGIGIAVQDLRRVHEPFVQVNNPLNHRHTGTGLGLPAVNAIMELHGGRLELKSILGTGTKATVIFPPERTGKEPSEVPTRSAA